MPLRLFIARGNAQGQSFIAVQSTVFIGRDAGCDVVLSDTGVSGRHVRIVERDGRYFAEDLTSSNGTLLNGAPLPGERELNDGDALGIGGAVVQLSILDAPDATSRKKLMPQGVSVSKLKTGERAPVRADDDGPTVPVGRPLPPIDRKKYEADTEKTAPIGKPLENLDLPPPPLKPPPATLSHPNAMPTQQAKALFPWPTEGERETKPAPAEPKAVESTEPHGKPAVLVPLEPRQPAPAAPDDSLAQTAIDPREKATIVLPPLPAAAEPMTAIDASIVEQPAGEPTRSDRPANPGAVLVSAAAVLKQAPDTANVETRLAPSVVVPANEPQRPVGESAADRARKKRHASATLGGQLAWYWNELTPRARIVIGVLVVAVALGTGFGVWTVYRPPPGRALPDEPAVLSSRPIEYSFGYGDGVDYEHVDFKELRFEVKAATSAAVVVHYRAQDVGHEEVSVSVNGHEAGFAPADMGMPDRDLETLLSQFWLVRDGPNVLVFDNVKNPPGKERWRISNLWLELIPVPEVTPEQAIAAAKEAHAKAELLEKQRAAGDDTLFKLWRTLRQGWIAMLALKEEQRTWLFADLKRRADAARVELDVQCGTLMLEAKKQIELKNPEGAKEILEGVWRWFPTKDHPCPALAEEKLREYDL